MPARFSRTVEIAAPCDRVVEIMSDVERGITLRYLDLEAEGLQARAEGRR
jgi:hypothetical protein